MALCDRDCPIIGSREGDWWSFYILVWKDSSEKISVR
jgi:hypothetical protein